MKDYEKNISIGKEFDFWFLLAVLLLVCFSLVLIYSAGTAKDNLRFFEKQMIAAAIGIIIMAVAILLSPRVYYALSYIGVGSVFILLLFVLIAGVIGLGAKRWIPLGGFHLQPSEPAKLVFILAVSRILSDWRTHPGWKLIGLVFLIAVPITLVILVQPDLGTSTVIPVLTVAMLAWYGIPVRYFVTLIMPVVSAFLIISPFVIGPLILAGLIWLRNKGANWLWIILLVASCAGATIIAPLAWDKLKPYQKKRLQTFVNPAADPLGSGYQVIQSKVAIGSGGVSGMGYMQGTQTQLRFLPEQHTDFIFSLAGEEFGFIGTSAILFLYLLMVYRGFLTASRVKNQYMSLVAAGATCLLLYHAIINIGMAIGHLPVTGLPLPFISYGGSFLITCMAAAGLILSTSLHHKGY